MARIDVEKAVAPLLQNAPDVPRLRARLLPDGYRMLWDAVERMEQESGTKYSEAEIDRARERLEILLTGMPSKPPPSAVPKPAPAPPTLDALGTRLSGIVGDVFSTTVDGSTERADYLSERARAEVDRTLGAATHLSRTEKRTLRAAAEAEIARERANIIF